MTREVVVFAIAADLPLDLYDEVLGAVSRIRGVVHVELFSPQASVPEVRRMGAAIIDGPSGSAVSASRLVARIPGIEYAAPPAARGLL